MAEPFAVKFYIKSSKESGPVCGGRFFALCWPQRKWFFYAFYPVHLAVIAAVQLML